MGGRTSGISTLRKTLPRNYRRGVLLKTKGDRRCKPRRDAEGRLLQLIEDQGGISEVATSMLWTGEHAAFLKGRASEMEAAALAGKPIDMPSYLAIVGVLVKLYDRLGYQRRARKVTLADLLANQSPPPPAKSAGPVQPEADSAAGGVP